MTPIAKLCGKTVAKITKNVGLQVVKTGPSAAPTRTSVQKLELEPSAEYPFDIHLSGLLCPGIFRTSLAQVSGKIKVRPNAIKIRADIYDQNEGPTFMSAVLPFNIKVKMKTDTESEPIIMSGRLRFFVSVSEPAKITGKSGKTHGARTVKIPAIKETIKITM